MKKMLFIVGSMREDSFNHQLSKTAKAYIADRADVSYLDYAAMPYMNQDIEYPAPAEVVAVRAEVEAADGIWIFTPEYNFSYPGVLKNLLDWLSRPLAPNDYAGGTSVTGKKVAITGVAGKSAASGSRAKLTELLGLMKMEVMEPGEGFSINPEAWQTGELALADEDIARLKAQADAFLSFIEG